VLFHVWWEDAGMRASRVLLKGCCLIGFGMQRQPAKQRVNDNRRMSVRIAALLVWALAAASAVFWGLRAFSATKPVPPGAAAAPSATIATGGPLNKVLGMTLVARAAEAEPADEDSRFRLLGVVAPRNGSGGGGGVALISVGDEPAKPFRVGATIDGDAVLLAVAMRRADIGPRGGPASVQLELPSPDSAATSGMPATLPPPTQQPGMLQRPMPPSGLPQPGARPGEIMPVRPPLQAPSAPHQPQAADMNDEEEE
jgi:general secretion pathway protein C